MALQIFSIILGPAVSAHGSERAIPQEEQVSLGGTLILRDGISIEVSEFLSPLKDNYIQGEYQGNVIRIKATDLVEISLLDVGCGYGYYYHGPQWKGRMRITYRSGKSVVLWRADFCAYDLMNRDFQYKVWNEALGKDETRWIMTTRIEKILIGGP
jgi:hypothetical protein